MDGSRILVIDDSTTLRKLVEIAMRGTGSEVDFAANGSDGVSRARTNRPDVILLDYLLPDLRSAEVCQRLHDDTATASVPVVIMSANQRSVLDDFRKFSTVVGFIGKPFTAAEIRARLEGVVRRGGRLAAGTATIATGRTAIASGSTAGSEASGALQLRGDLVATPLLEVLRLLAATHATGALVVDPIPRDLASLVDPPPRDFASLVDPTPHDFASPVDATPHDFASPIEQAARVRIWLRRGEILMCSGSNVESSSIGELTPALRERVTRNLLIGKPVQVTLAEAGVARVTNLPLELQSASARVIGELLDARSGPFAWEPVVSLPDFVEAFGRQVSLTMVALEHSRRAGFAAPPGVLEHVYDRTPRFSEKVAGARLNAEEQRVLALLDGQTTGGDIAARAKLPPDRGAAILTRLCAADLIYHDPVSRSASARTLAVLDVDGGELIASLRARLGRGSQPIEVIELDPARSLAQATLEARPAVVLVGVAALSRQVLEHELPIIARNSTIAVVCVLESPNPRLATQMLRAGLHAVIAKPVHLTEIERLLSA